MTWNKVLTALRVRAMIGGLEITDTALRFARYDGSAWRTASLRLPPGIIEGGYVRNHAQLVEALRELAGRVRGPRGGRREPLNVIVSLSSINIYSQVFSLPMVKGENLEKAVQLNIQMVSPVESSKAYSGWQLVNQDQELLRLEILSAFINKEVVDGIRAALAEAGFLAHAIESRALSLVRLIRELAAGFNRHESYLALTIDSSGLEFVVLRQGQLYFQYFMSWRDLYGDNREVPAAALEALIVRNLHQVLNFYNTHWSELLAGIFVAAGGIQDQVTRIITENFSLKVIGLRLTSAQAVSQNWFVALGTGLRSLVPRREDTEISLLGVSAQGEFRRQQLLNFLDFWRVLVPVTLGILVLVLGIADVSLSRLRGGLERQAFFSLTPEQSRGITALHGQAQSFNRSVSLIQKIEQARLAEGTILDRIVTLMRSFGVTPSHLYLAGSQLTATVSGHAPSQDQIKQFKAALDQDVTFRSVNLPLQEIKSEGDQFSFLINFSIVPPTAR